MNNRAVVYTVGKVILLEALLLLLPLAACLICGESCTAFLITAAFAAVTGSVLTLAFGRGSGSIYSREGFAIVSFSWLGVSLVGAMPFVLSGTIPSPVDAFFETVSGFTTTGASILTDVESVGKGMLLWRSLTHWIGGMGILVFVMAISEKSSDGSLSILRAEMPGHNVDRLVPRVGDTAKLLYLIYIGMTVLETVLLLGGGMPLFDSIVHALGTAGTGGFGIKADSIAGYSPYLQWVIAVFMLLFGVSFNIYYLIIMKKWRSAVRSDELMLYLGMAAVCTAVVTLNIYPVYKNAGEALRLAAFQVSSVVTTTGYATADFNLWPQLSKAVLFILMFCGGCMGSTAGGLKMSRVLVLFRIIKAELRKAVSPRSVSGIRLNGRQLDAKTLAGTGAYFALYALVTASVFLLISFEPFGLETNLSAAVACVNNIGPGFGLVGPAAGYSDYSAFSKLVLSAAMLLGRLEVYPLLLCVLPAGAKR